MAPARKPKVRSAAQREYNINYCREWYQKNKVEVNAARREYYRKNKAQLSRAQRLAYRKNPKRFRGYRLKTKYGMSLAEFERRVASQDGKCLICGLAELKMVVDHDHETKAVRGVLCGNCNSGIGLLKDSIEVLTSAIRYLKKAQKEGKDARSNDRAGEKSGRL